MEDELMAIFGREVDLVERAAIVENRNRFVRHAILDSVVLLDVASDPRGVVPGGVA